MVGGSVLLLVRRKICVLKGSSPTVVGVVPVGVRTRALKSVSLLSCGVFVREIRDVERVVGGVS
jgi:hypothetical protein